MRNTTSDIRPTHWAKVSARVYCSRTWSAKTRSNFAGSKTRSSVPRTMTLTGLRSRNFSKHLPKTILLSLPFPKTSCRGSPPGSEHHTRNLDLTKDRDLYRAGKRTLQTLKAFRQCLGLLYPLPLGEG